jgi:uncharacterized damage-inducible protein DinB
VSLKNNFLLMSEYNKWMNESLYSAASSLSHEDLAKNRGAFFGSIIATLNHITVADIIWLERFSKHPNGFPILDNVYSQPSSLKLDSILFTDLNDLKRERVLLDNTIVEFVKLLTDEVLASNFSYKNTKGIPFKQCFGHVVQHFFNHQTHHRGQLSTLLSQLGIEVGVTDLLAKIPSA